jgi:hypothetical protein
MNFGEILSRAWNIIWKHKVLWIFGILASCSQRSSGGGGGGGGSSSVQSSGGNNWNGEVPRGLQEFFFNLERFFNQIEGWQIAAIVAGVIFVFLVLWLLFLALGTIGRIGLIQGTIESEEGTEKLTFGGLFNRGKPFFWRILGLNLLISLAALALVMVLIIPLVLLTVVTFGVGLLCLMPLLCLLVPIGWLIQVIIQQANIALIVDDLNIFDAIQRGWDVFRANWGNLVVMALILGIGGAIAGFIIALPFLLIIIPVAISAAVGSMAESEIAFGGGLVVGGLCLAAYIPILILLSGVLQAYIQTAWTLTYLRLTSPSAEPALDEPIEEAAELEE